MSTGRNREQLVAELDRAMRDASGQGVMYSAAVAERLGINPTDLECLDLVVRGPTSAGALAEATGLTTGAITGVLDRLERAGFVRRKRDPHDRRKVLVEALPAVTRRVMPLFEPMQRAAAGALSAFSDQELELLLAFLSRAHAAAVAALTALRAGSAGRAKSQSVRPKKPSR
jgi:DNA-binding MarR family transcriptional regulator